MRSVVPTTDYATYWRAWERVALAGYRQFNVDTWASGRRYLSLTAVALTRAEVGQLRALTDRFAPLLDRAVEGILADPDWWPALAWPWPAIELARQEPPHPDGLASLYGRFDYLLDANGSWQVVEYNADTPSGGREASGLEPTIARLFPSLSRIETRLAQRLTCALLDRIRQHDGPVRLVGVVSTHRWLEDLSQAVWLTTLLQRAGQPTIFGDIHDVEIHGGRIHLRGQPIDALYRFYPIERLYGHAVFASVWEAALDGRLLLLNGLRGFLAQSKACLAWLWANRARLPAEDALIVEQHLPRTVLARSPEAAHLLPDAVIKHVNGREGDSVVFGAVLDSAGWQARVLEDGFVVQRAVVSPRLGDVEVDDRTRQVHRVGDRYACVGGFAIGGRFAGCYTRLDARITSARATYAATLCEAS
ncbi:MAG: glutathionylspermidine synthase family protein [Chloroflexi bacterium]|nr:glutathionylspermidine synthase family protein [Chloroflexota bacterium]